MGTATKEDILNRTKSIITFANDNLEELDKVLRGNKSEINTYFLGLIRRQSVLACDIKNILTANNHNSFISIYIICRCILDDYIRLKYIINSTNTVESIISLNADAKKKNMDNLCSMAKINDQFIHKNPPFYPTIKFMDKIKEEFLSNPSNDKYFKNKVAYKYKHFPTTKDIVENFEISEKASMYRSFYLWRHFSDYIHFSSFSASLEMTETQNCFNFVQESIYYSYKTCLIAMEYFKNTHGSSIVDLENLEDFYSNAEEL